MTQSFTTKSSGETQKIGKDIAHKLNGGGIIALYGDLGSGKTTFVQGFAKGLGIKQNIISPTFIIARKYEIPNYSSSEQSESRSSRLDRTINFFHIDLYRIENETDIKGLGLEEIFADKSNIVAIEWPEKIEKLLPEKALGVHFKYIKGDQRRIEII